MAEVLCLGDSCADIIIPYGESLTDQDVSVVFNCGGAAANTAFALGRLGVSVAFAGKAGVDLYGLTMRNELVENNVDVSSFILSDKLVSTQILIVIDEKGDRHPFLMPKKDPSYLEIYPEELEQIDLREMKYIITNGMMLFEDPAASTIVSFLEKARERGIKIMLDLNFRPETAGKDRSHLNKVIAMTDILLGSADEDFAILTGKKDLKEAVKDLQEADRTIVAHDKNGSTVFERDKTYHTDSYKVEVADTIGAGDVFNAGFIYGLIQGKGPDECNRLGCAAAAYSLMRPGARNTPDPEELYRFMKA